MAYYTKNSVNVKGNKNFIFEKISPAPILGSRSRKVPEARGSCPFRMAPQNWGGGLIYTADRVRGRTDCVMNKDTRAAATPHQNGAW